MRPFLATCLWLLTCCAGSAALGPYNPAQHAVNGFTPKQINGLQMWHDANRIVGLTNNQTCQTFEDLSGYGRNFTNGTSSKSPVFLLGAVNGKNAISFDGVDDYLATKASITLTKETVFIVFLYKTSSGSNTRIFTQRNTTEDYELNTDNYIPVIRSGNFYTIGSYAGNQFVSQISVDTNKNHVFSSVHSGTNIINYANGVSGSSALHTLNSSTVEYALGVYMSGFDGGLLLGTISESIMYNTTLTSAQRLQVERYLGTKYGIVVK